MVGEKRENYHSTKLASNSVECLYSSGKQANHQNSVWFNQIVPFFLEKKSSIENISKQNYKISHKS